MSLIGLQTSVAAMIRHPRLKNQWKPEFLNRFELTPSERRIAEKLSEHKELNKYGRDQANDRLQVMINHCDHVPQMIPQRVLQNIWFDLYEPQAMYVSSDHNGYFENSITFLGFLLENKDAQKRLKRCTPFYINDLIRFERAELELIRPFLKDPALHKDSILKTPHFRVVDLNFDIPAWMNGSEQDDEDLSKYKKDLTLVFVKSEDQFYPHIFEINAETKTFLLNQIGESSPIEASSTMKIDLKKMGLI